MNFIIVLNVLNFILKALKFMFQLSLQKYKQLMAFYYYYYYLL